MHKLTERQAEVLGFIADYQREHGYAPTVRDMSRGLYISVASAQRYIILLYERGYIRYEPKKARSISLI